MCRLFFKNYYDIDKIIIIFFSKTNHYNVWSCYFFLQGGGVQRYTKHIGHCLPDYRKNRIDIEINNFIAKAATSSESIPTIWRKHVEMLKESGLVEENDVPTIFARIKSTVYRGRREEEDRGRRTNPLIPEVYLYEPPT